MIELGFPAFVETRLDGPLFLTPAEGGDVLGPLLGLLNRMHYFVRPIVPNANVKPDNGWRHSFTTNCAEAAINHCAYIGVIESIGSYADSRCGDVTFKIKAATIRRLPSFDLDMLRAKAARSILPTPAARACRHIVGNDTPLRNVIRFARTNWCSIYA